MATTRIALTGALTAAAVAFAFCGAGAARAGDKQKEPVPFPVHRSQILRKDEVTYYVEGVQRIPKGVEVSCQKNIYIVAKGPGAVLEVEGSLQAHGVSSREVIFEGVTVRTTEDFEDCHLDMCIFRAGGGVRTPKDKPADGKLFLENVTLEGGSALDVTLCGGSIDISSVYATDAVRIQAVAPEGSDRNKVKVKIRGCFDQSGLHGGLIVKGAADVTIRNNAIGGEQTLLENCVKLTFDANRVTSKTLEFRQAKQGAFGKSKVQKCDIYTAKVIAFSPSDGGKPEKLSFDKCWFRGGIAKAKEVHAKVIEDAADSSECGVAVVFKKINERPLELAGSLDR